MNQAASLIRKPKINYNIAFIGNPNVGKSSLINRYSKKNKLSVGNWHGVTVSKQELIVKHKNEFYNFVDLPGIYDLNSKSIDEKISVNNIISGEFDLLVLVIDATKLKEGLFLLQQLKELNIPIFTLVNFIDLIPDNGSLLSFKKLEAIFKIPFIKVSCKKNINIDESLEQMIKYVNQNNHLKDNFFLYDDDLNTLKDDICKNLEAQGYKYAMGVTSNLETNKIVEFTAIKILEKSNHFSSHIKMENLDIKQINKMVSDFELKKSRDINDYFAYKRQEYNRNLLASLGSNYLNDKHIKWTRKIDNVLLNKWGSLFLLFAIFFISFIFIFNFSLPFKNWLDEFINSFMAGGISNLHLPNWLSSLFINGVLGGVGTIITFIPVIFLLFIWINILRESGYMARISFILTSLFNKIGLSGRSIIPLVLGFGCNVTSIYATRTIKSPVRRKVTALISPYMMCSARLQTVALIITSFFSFYAPLILICSYMLGIIVALILGFILKIRYSKEYDDLNIDELTLYNWPDFRVVIHSSFVNIFGFLKKASTIILVFSIFVWVVTYFPHGDTDPEHSILAEFSKGISVIFKPLGFGYIWQLVATIIPAITAKEVVISVLGILTNNSETQTYISLSQSMQDLGMAVILAFKGLVPIFWFATFYHADSMSSIVNWLQHTSAPSGISVALCALSFMVFILLTIPCVTTLAVMKKEFGYKFMFISVALGLLIPYIASLIIYWIGYGILLI